MARKRWRKWGYGGRSGGGGSSCYNCGQSEHMGRDCPQGGSGGGGGGRYFGVGRSYGGSDGRGYGGGGGVDGGGNCYNCGGSGNFARECPNASGR
ncbi:hypothetical protein QYF36_022339 [Acer negundo]|nr:hypothetical protein QYF36_022339 [Acer negundo]